MSESKEAQRLYDEVLDDYLTIERLLKINNDEYDPENPPPLLTEAGGVDNRAEMASKRGSAAEMRGYKEQMADLLRSATTSRTS